MTRLLMASLLTVLASASSEAHFLFIQIGPHAEAGRSVEVYFSDRATAGDPREPIVMSRAIRQAFASHMTSVPAGSSKNARGNFSVFRNAQK